MTALDPDNVRKLDALNLIEAFADEQLDVRREILNVYARASLKDNGLSCYELAHCCAHFASLLLQFAENGEELLAMCRTRLLDDEAP
jgi:hypothetical protein